MFINPNGNLGNHKVFFIISGLSDDIHTKCRYDFSQLHTLKKSQIILHI